MKSARIVPKRCMAPCGIAGSKNKFQQGYLIGKHAITLREPQGLFVASWVYQYGLWDEFSVLAYWTDHFAESAEATADRALACQTLPDDHRERVKTNLTGPREMRAGAQTCGTANRRA